MKPNEADHVGICTICQTVHVTNSSFLSNRECENCGSKSVYSINEVSDIVNDYFSLKGEYDDLVESMDDFGC